MRAVLLVAGVLWGCLWSVDAVAQPAGAHPRIWLTEATRQRWAELANQNGTAIAYGRMEPRPGVLV